MPRREWRAKKLGVSVDQLPDNRGRKESVYDSLKRLSIPITESGCIVWLGHCSKSGYGYISIKGKNRRVHRVVYELENGQIKEGLQIDHLCRVRCCLNINHLEMVTPKENTMRGNTVTAANAIKTICKRGHLLSGENLIVKRDGGRNCRTCKKVNDAASIQRRKMTAGGLSLSGILPD